MSAPVREQAILGPLIYAPPWARLQAPARQAGLELGLEADLCEDRMEPLAAEPVSRHDAHAPEPIAQPSAGFADDVTVMSLEECLALAPDQGDTVEEVTELDPQRWPGIAWPVAARLACTLLLALAGAMGFRWLSAAPGEPREGGAELAIHESLAHEHVIPASVAAFKADREPQSAPPLWSLDLMLRAAPGNGSDPGRQLTMSAAAAPSTLAGGGTAAAIISAGPAHRASHAPGSQGAGLGARATMVRAGADENR
jgi:hypothetical protein